MESKILFKIETDDPDGIDDAVRKWVETVLHLAPPEMQMKPERHYLAMPLFIQTMVIRSYMEEHGYGYTHISAMTDPHDRRQLQTLMGYKVIAGYEMAIVVFNTDAPLDNAYLYHVPIPGNL